MSDGSRENVRKDERWLRRSFVSRRCPERLLSTRKWRPTELRVSLSRSIKRNDLIYYRNFEKSFLSLDFLSSNCDRLIRKRSSAWSCSTHSLSSSHITAKGKQQNCAPNRVSCCFLLVSLHPRRDSRGIQTLRLFRNAFCDRSIS